MAQMELPLPELVIEDFTRSWIRFEFVATAKEWTEAKQLTVIPTLLRGKLIDYYVELDDATTADLKLLKAALQERAGKKEDPLVASKDFNERRQTIDERVADYASALKKLFKVAYPGEAMTSTVLLQRFLMGLQPEIRHQLLLRKKSSNFAEALADAVNIEYALKFNGGDNSVQAVAQPQQKPELPDAVTLQNSLADLTKRLASLETTLQRSQRLPNALQYTRRTFSGGRGQGQRRNRRVGPCYNCGEEGHLFRSCPLNYYGPASQVDESRPRQP